MTLLHNDLHELHLALPTATYDALTAYAKQRHQPETQLACTAIEDWLKQQTVNPLHQDIAAYAAACAGTTNDLDEDLEAAGLEQWGSPPLKRGEIWWATLTPRSGSEQAGIRPVLIISHDKAGWNSLGNLPHGISAFWFTVARRTRIY